MKKYIPIVSFIAVLSACSSPEETYEVQERDFNEAVYASGQVMPSPYRMLEVNAAERIMKILVEEGSEVDSGSVIAVLGTPSENRQVEILSSQLALARDMARDGSAVLDELRARARLARTRYQQDSLNAVRYRDLAAERAVSQKEADQARLEAESSRTEYYSLRQQYESRRNELKRSVLQAEHQLAQLSQNREGKLLASPFKGKVFRMYQKEGSLVNAGEPVAMVGGAERFMLELLVDERDISKVQLGQKVYFQTDVHADRQFEARISKIIPVLQKESRSFEVEAEVLAGEGLFPQSSVEANILIRENSKALVIPADYVISGDSVSIKQGDELGRIKITAGARDGSWVEVKSGLQAGDVIVKRD